MKYPKPKVFQPSEKDVQEALKKVAEFLSPDKEISSANYPELKVRGKRK
jgi:hypothetical protein